MLFIYGSLREEARNRRVVENLIKSWQPATAIGSLYHWGKYPLLLKTGGANIVGELLELIDEPAALKELDLFEGPEYNREEIEVTTESGEKKITWTYLYCKDSPPDGALKIESGDWVEYSRSIK